MLSRRQKYQSLSFVGILFLLMGFQNCKQSSLEVDSSTISSFSSSEQIPTGRDPASTDPAVPVPTPTSTSDNLLPTSTGKMGVNLGGIGDSSPQWVFVDLMKVARPWITQEDVAWYPNKPWDTGVRNQLVVDENGYPLEIPFTATGQTYKQVVTSFFGNQTHPGGEYFLLADGDGEVGFSGVGVSSTKLATPLPKSDVSYSVKVASSHSSIQFTIKRSSATNHLRNIRFIMPGFLDTYETQPFHPLFIERLKGFKFLRYMDFLSTNGNKNISVANRTKPGMLLRSGYGGAIEYVADISNATQTDPWVNIPHQADDEYIHEMATVLFNRLGSDRKVYVEYSNEVWNSIFAQTSYLYNQGCTNATTFVPFKTGQGTDWGIAGCDDLSSAYKFHVMRLAKIYEIFISVFGADRVVKIVAAQAANANNADKLISYFKDPALNPNMYMPDALAIAPYFGGPVANAISTAALSSTVTPEEVLQKADADMAANAFSWMQKNKTVADKYGLKLVAYEGGPHLVGIHGVENDTVLTDKLMAANRLPGMGLLYEKYLNYWFNDVHADLFMVFTNVDPFSKWGSWGIIEYQNQPLDQCPKYQAIRKFF